MATATETKNNAGITLADFFWDVKHENFRDANVIAIDQVSITLEYDCTGVNLYGEHKKVVLDMKTAAEYLEIQLSLSEFGGFQVDMIKPRK